MQDGYERVPLKATRPGDRVLIEATTRGGFLDRVAVEVEGEDGLALSANTPVLVRPGDRNSDATAPDIFETIAAARAALNAVEHHVVYGAPPRA